MGYYLLAEPTQVIQFYLLIRGIKQLGESYRNDISNAGFLSRAWKVPNTPDPTWAPKKPNIQEGEEDPQAPSTVPHYKYQRNKTDGSRHGTDYGRIRTVGL